MQRQWRKYLVYKAHLRFKFDRNIALRIVLAIKIQGQMRMFLGKKRAREYRVKRTKFCVMVQSLFRGFRLRKWSRINLAAKRITRFIRSVGDMRRRDAIYTVFNHT